MPYIKHAVGKFPSFEPNIKSITLAPNELSRRACQQLKNHLIRSHIDIRVEHTDAVGCTVYYEEARERSLRHALVEFK